jgi:hypothetical protein
MNLAVLTTPTRDGISPALYDAMCRAIDAAYEVDEVKDIRDRALAFEVYARLAQNVEAERRACEIRLRSERKAGALLRAMKKSKGAAEPGVGRAGGTRSDGPTTLRELGVSKQQSADWQKLADVPEEQFAQALSDYIHKPSTAGIIAAGTPPKPEVVPVSPHALWLWGRLHDFKRDGMLARDQADVLRTLTPRMLDDVHTLAPQVAAWLAQIGKASDD